MMRDVVGCVLLAAVVGCAADPEGDATGSASLPLVFQPFPTGVCSHRRMVVYDTSATCPFVGGWVSARLFVGANEPELTRYCLYRFAGAGEPPPAVVAALPPNRGPDCLVVAPAAEPGWFPLHDAFTTQIDPPVLRFAQPPAPAPARTWLAVVDSSPPRSSTSPGPPGEAIRGRNPHGFVLGRIARETGCPHGPSTTTPCVVHVHHELALTQVFTGSTWTAPPDGGHFGHQGELAVAIDRAVDAWLAGRSSPSDHLVVNLSLGWLEAYGGTGGDTTLHVPPSRAVFAAIQRAVCHGAIVYAAAGNWSGGTRHTTGPIYPAAWTREPAPAPARCADFFGPLPGYKAGGRLVEAVGAVDGRDGPLGNARPGATPRVVAPGFRGSAFDPGGIPMPTLAGTSVSTAVASTAAAIAWAYAPSLDNLRLAETVYASGLPLGRVADSLTCFGTCAPVRRTSACSALRAACTEGPGRLRPGCVPVSCRDRPAGADARPVLDASMFPAPTVAIRMPRMRPLVGVTPAECEATTALYRLEGLDGPGEMPCPDRQLYSGMARPDVGPQPNDTGCPVCNANSVSASIARSVGTVDSMGSVEPMASIAEEPSLSVDVQLDPAVVPLPLSLPSLLIVTSTGRYRYALWEHGGLELRGAPAVYRIDGIPRPPGAIANAMLIGRTARGEPWMAELALVAGF